jgi:tryptophanyl-tRNA synthetase
VGLRKLSSTSASKQAVKTSKSDRPSFKQYREPDGKFYFKLVDVRGRLLLQSTGFDSPKEAGQTISALSERGAAAALEFAAKLTTPEGVDSAEITQALQVLSSPTL